MLNTENGGLNRLYYIDHTIGAYLRRNILLPVYWKYVKKWRTLEYYNELKEHQWNTLEENRNLQRKKLFELVKYAGQNIPYYKHIIQKYNIRFSEDTIFEDIKKFPILTKEIIRNNFNELYKLYYFQVVFTLCVLSYRKIILFIRVQVKHIFAYHQRISDKGSCPLVCNPDSFF